jgi:hypothetical protein
MERAKWTVLRVSTMTLHLPSYWLENSTTGGAKVWVLTGERFQRLMKILLTASLTSETGIHDAALEV